MAIQTSLRFTQFCPSCGRRVEIRASLLGHTVACQHCHAEFIASENCDGCKQVNKSEDLLARAEEALRRAEQSVSTTVM